MRHPQLKEETMGGHWEILSEIEKGRAACLRLQVGTRDQALEELVDEVVPEQEPEEEGLNLPRKGARPRRRKRRRGRERMPVGEIEGCPQTEGVVAFLEIFMVEPLMGRPAAQPAMEGPRLGLLYQMMVLMYLEASRL